MMRARAMDGGDDRGREIGAKEVCVQGAGQEKSASGRYGNQQG